MHILSTKNLEKAWIDNLLEQAKRESFSLREGEVVLLFLEPSTRTRVSFEIAAKRLGLDVILASNLKADNFLDLIDTFLQFAPRALILRTSHIGAAREAAERSKIPIINAGDGAGEHPTQALADLLVLRSKGSLKGKKLLFLGDTRYSRVTHSLLPLLRMEDCRVACLSPPDLTLPGLEVKKSKEGLEEFDFLYLLRPQNERWFNEQLPSNYLKSYGLVPDEVGGHQFVLHAGPVGRGVELSGEFENSLILEQVRAGLALRIALLDFLV